MRADKPLTMKHVHLCSATGGPISTADDALAQRRQTAAKVRRAAAEATRHADLNPQTAHPAAAGAQTALLRALAQSDAGREAVVWRYLSRDAKPLDQWASGRTVATHSHFTPFCPPEPEEADCDEIDLADIEQVDASAPVAGSIIGDMLLLIVTFAAFPLSLAMSGLPSLGVVLTALLYKLIRGRRFGNGLLALIVALSLVGAAAGALRAAKGW